jgi:hypothetical protein
LRRPNAVGTELCSDCTGEVEDYLRATKLPTRCQDLAIRHLWEIGCVTSRYGSPDDVHPQPEILLRVPTYYGNTIAADGSSVDREEFDKPTVPLLVYPADGVRIVLGSHDLNDLQWPDVQIERRPKGWVMFLHPLGGSDPSGYVYFLDNGSSYLLKEPAIGPTPPIEVLEADEALEGIER